MNWKLKALAFKTLSAMPFGSALHFQLQRKLQKTWPRKLDKVEALAQHAGKVVKEFSRYSSVEVDRAVFLELGGGRDLVVPLTLRALGVARVVCIDVERLAKLELINHSAALLSEIMGCEQARFDSWQALRDYGIDYRAPFSIENSLAENGEAGFDAMVSNEVLEHIPEQQLIDLLSGARYLLKSDGLSIHSIDYSDHYARDCGVSRYNFLKFSVAAWKKYNSRVQFVNRLRHSDFLEIFLKSGFEIQDAKVYSEQIPGDITENLSDHFKKYSREDLAIQRARIIARKNNTDRPSGSV